MTSGFFPTLELAMLQHQVDLVRELAKAQARLTTTKSGAMWGFGEDFTHWRDLAEAHAALEAFPPRAWWKNDPDAWNNPIPEPPL